MVAWGVVFVLLRLLLDAADVLVVVDMSSLNFRRRRRIEGRSEFDRLTSDDDVLAAAATVVDCDDFMGLSPSASRFADLIRSPPSFVVDFPATAVAGSTSSFFILLVGLFDGFWLSVDFSSFNLCVCFKR